MSELKNAMQWYFENHKVPFAREWDEFESDCLRFQSKYPREWKRAQQIYPFEIPPPGWKKAMQSENWKKQDELLEYVSYLAKEVFDFDEGRMYDIFYIVELVKNPIEYRGSKPLSEAVDMYRNRKQGE